MEILELNKNAASGEILCIPGLFMTAQAFVPVADYIPEYHFVCVTLDSHHSGCDEYPGREAELEKLSGILKNHGWTHFDLCIGLSLGSILSVCLARQKDIVIDRILLDGAVNFYRSGIPFLEKAAMSLIFRNLIKGARKKQARSFLNISYSDSWEQTFQACPTYMSDDAISLFIRELSDFSPQPGLRQPIHCLYGSKENNLKANIRIIRQCYPQATFEIRQGHNHMTFLNQEPEEFAGIVKACREADIDSTL